MRSDGLLPMVVRGRGRELHADTWTNRWKQRTRTDWPGLLRRVTATAVAKDNGMDGRAARRGSVGNLPATAGVDRGCRSHTARTCGTTFGIRAIIIGIFNPGVSKPRLADTNAFRYKIQFF